MKTNYYFPKKYLSVYNNGGKTLDRITIVFNKSYIQKSSFKLYDCISASETGSGIYMHGDCIKGKHLGKKINFSDLSEDLKSMFVNNEIFSYNLCQYWRNPTPFEIKQGYGAIHYKSFNVDYITSINGGAKRSITCPVDGLKYYRC